MNRAAFNPTLFHHALEGLLPDREGFSTGGDGFFVFCYYPKDDADWRSFQGKPDIIMRWLDSFDILFSRSQVKCYDYKSDVQGRRHLHIQVTMTPGTEGER